MRWRRVVKEEEMEEERGDERGESLGKLEIRHSFGPVQPESSDVHGLFLWSNT